MVQGAVLMQVSAGRDDWRRNLFAVTAASFIGFTGFTLVMPFLPLYFHQLGVEDVGESRCGPASASASRRRSPRCMAPFWGRLADRFGRKIMVERSLVSFVVVMAAMAFVDRAVARVRAARRPGAVRRLRRAGADDGGGFGAEGSDGARRSGSCRRRSGSARRSGPVFGGAVAQIVGLRRAFFVTAAFYLVALVLVFFDVRRAARGPGGAHARRRRRPRDVPQRAGVRELRPADGR